MSNQVRMRLVLFLAVYAGMITLTGLWAQDSAPKEKAAQAEPAGATVGSETAATVSPVQPKPLSENVKKGLAYLASQQHANGGWSQGEESAQMGDSGGKVRDIPNVGDTCMAALALVRAGNTPKEGQYADHLLKAIDFICTQVEKANTDTLYVTDVRGTRLQGKLGPYVDTFTVSLLFAELKGRMPDEKSEKRLVTALDKTLAKIQKNQRPDGTWASEGWAPILSQSIASKGLNRAAQNGFAVSVDVLARAEKYAKDNSIATDSTKVEVASSGSARGASPYRGLLATTAGRATSGPALGSAGVPLYDGASNFSNLQDAVNTNKLLEKKAREIAAKPSASQAERDEAKAQLKRFAETEQAHKEATAAFVKRLDDKQFIQGFGSNGGEEFLSYMNISETMLAKGGAEWEKWDKRMAENLNNIQNKDGSWTGHHCITGRTFCTAAALLVLMADRAPVPIATKLGK
ncbi:MAG TPA: prenyltransferase/squalene oxidase repeat-containing protein [Gemmataceae bacterium]|nr:prenyltransferase/squalene oxidase repeat-containing protein [Gemmataceae bacterium]